MDNKPYLMKETVAFLNKCPKHIFMEIIYIYLNNVTNPSPLDLVTYMDRYFSYNNSALQDYIEFDFDEWEKFLRKIKETVN